MPSKADDPPDNWITFEAAGRLIDGPNGWHVTFGTSKRPRAEALLKFACAGDVRTEAAKWKFTKAHENELDAPRQQRTAFLNLLLYRLKGRKEKFEITFDRQPKMLVEFDIADDVNGHYEVSVFELNYSGSPSSPHHYRVTALRFSRHDIASLFQLADVPSEKPPRMTNAKAGRPAAADWEGAALEMARRFYVGDLKPDSVAAVQRHLTEWLAAEDVHPSATTLRDHAKRCYDAFLKWNDD